MASIDKEELIHEILRRGKFILDLPTEDKVGLGDYIELHGGRKATLASLRDLFTLTQPSGYDPSRNSWILLTTGGHDCYLSVGEGMTITAHFMQGLEDLNSELGDRLTWEVARDTGVEEEDLVWAYDHNTVEFRSNGVLDIDFSDLGEIPTVFTFTGTVDKVDTAKISLQI